jgi:hypothetical protein
MSRLHRARTDLRQILSEQLSGKSAGFRATTALNYRYGNPSPTEASGEVPCQISR